MPDGCKVSYLCCYYFSSLVPFADHPIEQCLAAKRTNGICTLVQWEPSANLLTSKSV